MKRLGLIAGVTGMVLLTLCGGWYFLMGKLFLPGMRNMVFLVALLLSVLGLVIWHRELLLALRNRRMRIGLHSVLLVLVVAMILLLVNFVAAKHRIRHDMTEMQRWSLSPVTLRVLRGLEEPVKLIGFFTSEQKREVRTAREIFKLYAEANPLVEYSIVDPIKEPLVREQYGIKNPGTTLAECAGRYRSARGTSQTLVTNLIAAVAGGERRVLFLAGHGMRAPGDRGTEGYRSMGDMLQSALFEVTSAIMMPGDRIDPREVSLTVLAGPTEALEPFETDLLDAYLRDGGHLLVFIDPIAPGDVSPVSGLLDRWGLEARPGVLAQQNDAATPWLVFATRFSTSRELLPVTRELTGSRMVFDRPGPLAVAETADPRLFRGPLVMLEPSDDRVFLVPRTHARRPDPTGEILPMAEDEAVAVASFAYREVIREGRTVAISRLAVIGDADFADNYTLLQHDNRRLLAGLVRWLTEEHLVVEEESGGGRLQVRWREHWRPVAIILLVPPLLVALLGVAVLLHRRWR